LHDAAEELGASLIVFGSETEPRLVSTSTGERVIAGAPCPVAMPPRGWSERPSQDLGRILVAFVPTPDGREALRVAATFARRIGARLHVVTVVAGPAEVTSYRIGEDVDRMYVSTAKETFEHSIEQAISELALDVKASGEVVVEDHPVEALASMANSSFDALFIGSRGYGPIRRVLLGGVASRLVRRLAIPAVIVPRSS
jgi:nucleotide-binding universal stress UspA family protein